MIDPGDVPPISDEETVARYVTQSRQFRADGTVRPNVFMPYRRVELSVTRHLHADEHEIWAIGMEIARGLARTLYGRADICVGHCKIHALYVEATPIKDVNPNHADIKGCRPKSKIRWALH